MKKEIQPEIFNLENKAQFNVAELKEFSEKFAIKMLEKHGIEGIMDVTGFWDECKGMFYDRFVENKNDD